MKYFKITDGNYILGIYTARKGNGSISREEYENISNALRSIPYEGEHIGHRLKLDMTWERFDIPVKSEEN